MVFHDQQLTPHDYQTFGRHFGDLQDHTRQEFVLPGHPTIYVLSNKVVDGKPIGVHKDGMGWHTDGTYVAKPLETTMLVLARGAARGRGHVCSPTPAPCSPISTTSSSAGSATTT